MSGERRECVLRQAGVGGLEGRDRFRASLRLTPDDNESWPAGQAPPGEAIVEHLMVRPSTLHLSPHTYRAGAESPPSRRTSSPPCVALTRLSPADWRRSTSPASCIRMALRSGGGFARAIPRATWPRPAPSTRPRPRWSTSSTSSACTEPGDHAACPREDGSTPSTRTISGHCWKRCTSPWSQPCTRCCQGPIRPCERQSAASSVAALTSS